MRSLSLLAAVLLLCGGLLWAAEPGTNSPGYSEVKEWSASKKPGFDHLFLLCGLEDLDQGKLDEFLNILGVALVSKDAKELEKCFYWGNTPEPLRDIAINEFEQIFGDHQFYSASLAYLTDRRLNQGAVKLYSSGKVMNGRHYDPNLKPVLMVLMIFRESNSSSPKDLMKWLPLGLTPEGAYRFPGTIISQKTITEQEAVDIAKAQLVAARPDLRVLNPTPYDRFVGPGPHSGGGPKWVVGFDTVDKKSDAKSVYCVTVFPDGRTSDQEIREGAFERMVVDK